MIFEKNRDAVAVYMILDEQRRVDLLKVLWFG